MDLFLMVGLVWASIGYYNLHLVSRISEISFHFQDFLDIVQCSLHLLILYVVVLILFHIIRMLSLMRSS